MKLMVSPKGQKVAYDESLLELGYVEFVEQEQSVKTEKPAAPAKSVALKTPGIAIKVEADLDVSPSK